MRKNIPFPGSLLTVKKQRRDIARIAPGESILIIGIRALLAFPSVYFSVTFLHASCLSTMCVHRDDFRYLFHF